MLEIEKEIKKININLKKYYIKLETSLDNYLNFLISDLLLEDIFDMFYNNLNQTLNEILWNK